MKVAAEIYLETVCAAIAEWLECPKVCIEAEEAILSDITCIINKNSKLLQINYLAQKVDILFHFPSRSQYTYNKTYGRTRQKWGS